jgi:hypothetical protein
MNSTKKVALEKRHVALIEGHLAEQGIEVRKAELWDRFSEHYEANILSPIIGQILEPVQIQKRIHELCQEHEITEVDIEIRCVACGFVLWFDE